MAEISFNNKFDQMNKLNQQFYDDYFEDNYDPTKPMDQQSNSLTMKSLNDGSTTPDFAAMQSAYNDAQNSKTKNSFFSMSADASMPDNFSGLQNSMGGLTLNPDGTLNYNNTQPQNLGFTSMVDMANKANNFNSQFASPGRFSGMGQVGPNKSNMNAPTALDMGRFSGISGFGVANEPDVEQVAQLGNPSMMQNAKSKLSSSLAGLMDFAPFGKKSISGMALRGLGSLFTRNPNSPSYNSRTPGFDYNNLNESMINDFYDSNEDSDTFGTNRFDRAVPGSFGSFRTLSGYLNRDKVAAKEARAKENRARKAAKAQDISRAAARAQQAAINRENSRGGGSATGGFNSSNSTGYDGGNFCFDPKTPIQMADGSTKEIKNIQLGDNTKGGEVTGVFQFKASDEIHDYKGVTVAGSHYVKEDGRFIMVKDSPLSIKIDKIPVVYSLDTTGRRIFINDIEFADYNGDGVAKNFLSNAGVNLSGFDKEVLRQVEQRLI